jgi:hypothetical protein
MDDTTNLPPSPLLFLPRQLERLALSLDLNESLGDREVNEKKGGRIEKRDKAHMTFACTFLFLAGGGGGHPRGNERQ